MTAKSKPVAHATGKDGLAFDPPAQFRTNGEDELLLSGTTETLPVFGKKNVTQRAVNWADVRLDQMRIVHTNTDFTLFYNDGTEAGEQEVGHMNLYEDEEGRMWLNNIDSSVQRIGVGLALLHAGVQVHGQIYAANGMRNDQAREGGDTRHLSVEGAALVTSAVRNGVLQAAWCFNPAEEHDYDDEEEDGQQEVVPAAAAPAPVFPVNNRVLQIAEVAGGGDADFAFPPMPEGFTSIQVNFHPITGGDGRRLAGVILSNRNDENQEQSMYPEGEGPDFESLDALMEFVMAHYNITREVIIEGVGEPVNPREPAQEEAAAEPEAQQQDEQHDPHAVVLDAAFLEEPETPFEAWMAIIEQMLQHEYGNGNSASFPEQDYAQAFHDDIAAADFYAEHLADGRAYQINPDLFS